MTWKSHEIDEELSGGSKDEAFHRVLTTGTAARGRQRGLELETPDDLRGLGVT